MTSHKDQRAVRERPSHGQDLTRNQWPVLTTSMDDNFDVATGLQRTMMNIARRKEYL